MQEGNPASGTPIQLASCDGTAEQQWTYDGTSFTGLAGKCLDVQGANTDNGTLVQLWDCNGTGAQQWTQDGGQLVGVGGKCLDVSGFNSVPGQTMQIWDCNGGQNQQFSLGGGCGGGSCGGGSSSGTICTPTTCAAQGATCGPLADGCGNMVDCGTCSGSDTCTTNACVSTSQGGAPGPAAGAGFNTLVFEDDFTTTDTIAPSMSTASGYKWYWSFDANEQSWTVQPTATAASISNGNIGGGNNASPQGGILTLSGPGAPNDELITVPGSSLNNGSAVLPAEGDGCWSHAYFEAYIQFKIDGNASTDPSNGWPAFWSFSVQGLHGYGFGSSSLNAANYSEIDFMESYGTIFNEQPGNWTATMHQWPANDSSDGDTQQTDNNWHTYGCLWTSTGDGTGEVQFYFDGVQADQTIEVGTNQTQFSLEGMYQFIVLGTGQNWDMNVDWVRVWQ